MIAVFRAVLLLAVPMVSAQPLPSPAPNAQSPFLSVPPAVSDTLRFGSQLPGFEAKDISGRTWRSEDLRGKLTVVYIWDTFQGRVGPPAFRDLPELQRFYDKVRNSKSIQVLTFCNDYDYMHAHDFIQREKYTFPVIADWVLVKKLFARDGLTLQSVINPEGRLSYPFRSWSLGRVLFEVERAAARN
jgi:hypothetical protein